MTDIVSIPTTTYDDNVTWYDIAIKLPLRSFSVSRRYSDFTRLVDELSQQLGISQKDFPYELPSKRTPWISKLPYVIEERKESLARFLNNLLDDTEFQNNISVHNFLMLPKGFRIQSTTTSSAQGSVYHEYKISSNDDINKDQWLRFYREHMSTLVELRNRLESIQDIKSRLKARDLIKKGTLPSTDLLLSSLSSLLRRGEIETTEYNSFVTKVENLKKELHDQLEKLEHGAKTEFGTEEYKGTSKRVFGVSRQVEPVETEETRSRDDKSLIQDQLTIQGQQDEEIQNLRKLIQRQKEIGLLINQEVEEQNDMLDSFSNELDLANDKLLKSRKSAKKIL